MVMAPPEAPEGERIARLEALTESVIREITDMKADVRDLRMTLNRFMFAVIAMWITTMLTVLATIITILFRM